MTDQTLNQYVSQLIEHEAREVDKQLTALNLTMEDIRTRCYRTIENGVTTYYFDGIPIVRLYIKYERNTIMSVVEKL